MKVRAKTLKTTKTVIHDLKEERNDLMNKIERLSMFKSSKHWYTIGTKQRHLLDYQHNIMCCYRDILTARIDDLKGDNE